MAVLRPLLPAGANENQSMDPRAVSSAAPEPAIGQAPVLTDFGLGAAADVDEFAQLRELLEAEINGGLPADFSFTGFLGNTTDINGLGFADPDHIVHGFGATNTNDLGFAAPGHMIHGLAAADTMPQGLASTEFNDPFSGIDSFFDLNSASQPVCTSATDVMALRGVGSQFGSLNSALPQCVKENTWENGKYIPDPSIFPPGFESASNVTASTPIRFNPYQVEGREGELPDLDALTRDFVRSAAVDLPNLGASDSGTKGSENNSLPASLPTASLPASLPAQPESVTPTKMAGLKFINKMTTDFEDVKDKSTKGKNTGDHVSSGLHAPTDAPVSEAVKSGVESGAGVVTGVAANDGGSALATMDTPAATANLPGTIDANPAAGTTAKDGDDKAKNQGARKRKADDASINADTGAGNNNEEAAVPRKKNKNGGIYAPRVDTSQPGTVSVAEPFITQAGHRTQDQGAVQQSNEDPDAPKWSRRLNSLLDCTDPWMCPGFNLDCFHAFQNTLGLFMHIENVHGIAKKNINKPEFKDMKAIFEPHPESWWIARGQDTTYQGTDRKQINARRRMKAGMRSNDPNYVEEVYVRTPAVRSAANKKATKK